MCSLQELEIPALELTFAQPDASYLQPAFNNSGGRGKIGPDQFQFLLLIFADFLAKSAKFNRSRPDWSNLPNFTKI
jgi:hypothetical protein